MDDSGLLRRQTLDDIEKNLQTLASSATEQPLFLDLTTHYIDS